MSEKQLECTANERIIETQEESEEDDEITFTFLSMENLGLGPKPYSTAI
jgi:hypothetical protein